MTHSVHGMTLSEFADSEGLKPAVARVAYGRLMRFGEGLSLPEPTRSVSDDGLWKFCLPVGDRLETESVVIPMRGHRGGKWHTLCVSSQVGCKMGCTFCETGRMGLLADLSPAEIVIQRIAARRVLGWHPPARPRPRPGASWRFDDDGVKNVVFMGMGEPLDNLDAVVHAIRVLSDPAGLAIPHSQITVSTAGRIDGLRKLGAMGWRRLRIAVSLNAADDRLRDELMPVNRGMPLKDLQRALLEYPLPPKGLFMIEYVLMKGVNDSPADADLVASWCRPLPCAVNLIPYNPQRGAVFETPSADVTLAFLRRLRSHGIFVKWRVTRGRDLMSACGQLGNPSCARSNFSSLVSL